MAGVTFDSAPWTMAITDAAAAGERVLGFGMKRLAPEARALSFEALAEGVEFLGLIGFIDPRRPEAAAAIAEARSAGIDVKMITGDRVATALAIARQLELAPDPQAITGAELETMSDEELAERVGTLAVFARASPEHKLRIVRALQAIA